MGKYSKYKNDLVKFQQEPNWQSEIDTVKSKLLPSNNTKLSEEYALLKDAKADMEQSIREINTRLEAISQILVDRMEEDGITSFKTENGTFFIKDEPYVSTQDRAALRKYIVENGMGDLLTVHYQTLSAMVKERMEAGEELPPGVAVYMKSSIQRRASKA